MLIEDFSYCSQMPDNHADPLTSVNSFLEFINQELLWRKLSSLKGVNWRSLACHCFFFSAELQLAMLFNCSLTLKDFTVPFLWCLLWERTGFRPAKGHSPDPKLWISNGWRVHYEDMCIQRPVGSSKRRSLPGLFRQNVCSLPISWGHVRETKHQGTFFQVRIDGDSEFAVAILLRTAKQNVENDNSFQMIHDIITLFSPCTIMHFQMQHLFLFLSVTFITSVHLIFYDYL